MLDHTAFVSGAVEAVRRSLAADPTPPAEGLAELGVFQAAEAVRAGQASASELVRASLSRIAAGEPALNSLITAPAEQALDEAAVLDAEQRQGRLRGPLHGVTICLKDNIDTAGVRTTAGSAVLQDRVPAEDAVLVQRLKAAGAVILAKTNMNEFAADDGHASFFGRVRNPWALDRETGGSSSGTAAAVAAALTHGGIGNDTGGSTRNPAAMCGVVGLKPTSGLVPNRGGVPLTPSLDANGPMTRSVRDAALLMNVIAGYDELDITSEDHRVPDYLAQMAEPVSHLRIGLPQGRFDMMEPAVAEAVGAAIELLSGLVAEVKSVSLPPVGPAMSLVPFGETYAWHRELLKSRRFLYSARHQALFDALAEVRAVDYIQARDEMLRLRRTINSAFDGFDLIVHPALTIVARPLRLDARPDPEMARRPGALFAAALYNVLGVPAISVPCGFSPEGLPIGLCIAGPRFADGRVLALAHAYEQAAPWKDRRPPLPSGVMAPPLPRAPAA